MEELMKRIAPFLDGEGRIAALPARQAPRREVLRYLSDCFETDRNYTEKEVNALIDSRHTFADYFVLRRGLVDEGFLRRERDGSRYWREKEVECHER